MRDTVHPKSRPSSDSSPWSPKLARALSMSLPNIGVSGEAVNLMKFALNTEH